VVAAPPLQPDRADWQYRVDFDRMRVHASSARASRWKPSTWRARTFAGANIRYVTGSYQGNWKYNINIRYVVLPRAASRFC